MVGIVLQIAERVDMLSWMLMGMHSRKKVLSCNPDAMFSDRYYGSFASNGL